MSEWKPIESAPTDGNPEDIVVWNGARVTVAFHSGSDAGWCDSLIEFNPEIEPQPTHWMPLPEPPAP